MKQALKSWVYGIPLVISLVYFFSDPHFLMTFLPDDLFYYLEAARRSASQGSWPTMDGINSTSGFHSFYMLFCITLYTIIGNSDSVINLSLFINLLVGYILSFSLYQLFKRHFSQTKTTVEDAIMVSFIVLNPIIFLISSRALENTFSATGMFLTVLFHLNYLKRNKGLTLIEAIILGIFIGCCGLLRTDSLLIACALGIIWLFHLFRYARSIKQLLIFAAMPISAALVMMLWWGPLYLIQGSISQDSFYAFIFRGQQFISDGILSIPSIKNIAMNMIIWIYRLLFSLGSPIFMAIVLAQLIQKQCKTKTFEVKYFHLIILILGSLLSLTYLGSHPINIINPNSFLIQCVIILIVFLLTLINKNFTVRIVQQRYTNPFLIITMCLIIGFYSFVFRHFQFWYASFLMIFLIYALSPYCLSFIQSSPKYIKPLLFIFISLNFIFTLTSINIHYIFDQKSLITEVKEKKDDYHRTYNFVKESGGNIGSFDSGIMSYFLHPKPVINLDGVMNHSVILALKKQRFNQYLYDQNIYYIFSKKNRINMFSNVFNFSYQTIKLPFKSDLVINKVVDHTPNRLD